MNEVFHFPEAYANATTPQQYVLQEHTVPEHFLWLSASMYIRIVERVRTYERLELWQRPQAAKGLKKLVR